MKLFTLYIALDTDKNRQPISIQQSKKSIKKILRIHGIHAYTWIDCTGYWRAKSEATARIEIADDSIDQIKVNTICFDLKVALNQECIMVTIQDIPVLFG